MTYLDNAATTFPKPEVVYETMDRGMRELSFNAGRGSYSASMKALDAIDTTRGHLGKMVGVSASRVVFSSSATEALNQIIMGLDWVEGDVVYVSPFEHNAIMRPLHRLEQVAGIKIRVIPFDKTTWDLDFEEFEIELSTNRVRAVFVSQVSNVTGFKLPYECVFSAARKRGAVTVLDSSQSFGILPVVTTDVDYVVFAGHKSLYGPFGVAGFIITGNHQLGVVKAGGTGSDSLNLAMPEELPGRFEAGSPNIVAIKALDAALTWAASCDIRGHEERLTKALIESLDAIPKVRLFVPRSKYDEVFSVVSFGIEDYESSDVGMILDEDFDIAVRTGYHCAPLVHDFIGSRAYVGTVRASIGYFNTLEDVDRLAKALESL